MRDQWLHEHQGPEARPTDAFTASLADTLQSEWRQPTTRVVQSSGEHRRSWLRPMMAAAAALAVLGGGAYVLGRDSKPSVTGDSTATTAAPTTPTTDATTLPTETTVAPTTPPTTLPATPVVAATPEEQTVLDYLTALAEGRWADAAKLLGEGGLSLEERSDLRPLVADDGTLSDLAGALQAWCGQPAMCLVPTGLRSMDNRIVATFTIDGIERSSTFVGATFEGSPLVTGLPLRFPPEGVSLADTVQCPTDGVDSTVYADLDGDGWDETVVSWLAANGAAISVCGTDLVVTTLDLNTSELPLLFTIDPEGDGRDSLLLGGTTVDTMMLTDYSLEQSALVATGRDVTQSNPSGGAGGTSFGCEDATGDGLRELVLYSYQYEGGTDLSNSTALTFTRTVLNGDGSVNPLPLEPGRYELPAQVEVAFRIISPHCGVLPVQTG